MATINTHVGVMNTGTETFRKFAEANPEYKKYVTTPAPSAPATVASGASNTPYTNEAKRTTTPSAPSASGVYAIGTQAGSDIVNRVKTTGKSEKTTDGSILSLGADGKVYAFQNGNKLLVQNNYSPPSSGAGIYVIRTEDGRSRYGGVLSGGNGASVYMNDNGADGKPAQLVNENGVVYAIKDGKKMAVQVGGESPNQSTANPNNSGAILSALIKLTQNRNNEFLSAQKSATDAAVQRAVNDINLQKKNTDLSYADLFRQLYINKMRTKKDLDQQLAAQGITGGMAETTRLGIDTSYADALRQGEIERLNTQAELDQAAIDTRLQGDISYATIAAQEAQQRQQSYASLLSSLLNRQYALEDAERSLALTREGWAREDRKTADALAAQTASADQQKMYALVTSVLENGGLPDDATLDAAGIPKQLAVLLAAQGGLPKQVKYTDTQAQTALYAAALGDRSAAVRAIVEGYYGLPLETVLRAYGN